MYDLVAGIQCLKSSYVLSKSKALELFPMLKKDKLVGAIVYYDGKYPLILHIAKTPAINVELVDWIKVDSSEVWQEAPGSLDGLY